MPDPRKPGWFSAHLQTSLPGEAADATAVRKAHPAKPGANWRAIRQVAGGAVGSLADIPITVTPYGVVHLPDFIRKGIGHAADAVAGGAPQDVSDESFRSIGGVAPWVLPYGTMNKAAEAAVTRVAPKLTEAGRLMKTLASPGSATLDAAGNAFSGSGYAVADPALTATVSSPSEMRSFLARKDVRAALKTGKHIGKWTDPATGVTEINIADVVKDAHEAQALGRQRGEKAVGHLQNGKHIADIRVKNAPVPAARRLAEAMQRNEPMARVTKIPADHGKRLADAYEKLPAHDPEAKGAYAALNKEVAGQLAEIKKAGYKVEYVDHDPYKSSQEMMDDVRDNKVLKVLKTQGGGAHQFMTADQNNAFRAVHDFIAHAGGGNQFGAVGEENAYRMHAATLSPSAQRALATETRGQNSWVNFGPNAHLPAGERPFAQQKAALFPEHLLGDYNITEGERVLGHDAAGNALTNRGRAVRDPLPPAPPIRASEGERAVGVNIQGDPVTNRGRTVPAVRDLPTPARTSRRTVAASPDTGLLPGPVGGRPKNSRLASNAETARGESFTEAHNDLARLPSAYSVRVVPGDAAIVNVRGDVVAHGATPAEARANLTLQQHGTTSRGQLAPIPGPWQPTSRGVFNRDVASIQGTAPVEPRLAAAMPRGEASELSQAIANSKVVERGLQTDAERGLPLGGDTWYEGAPIKAAFDEQSGPFSFHDFNLARGTGSIQNPTHNEVASATGLLFARRQGLTSAADIVAAHQEMHPGEPKVWLNKGHFTNYQRALENDAQIPATPGTDLRKVPWYTHGNEGGSLEGLPALDTHERRRLLQLAATDRKIKPLLKELGLENIAGRADGSQADIVPINNGLDYETLGRPYQRIAQRMGLPSTQAMQAGRWIGGAPHTGLLSQPVGDFTQTLEDAMLHTALTRGLPADPAGLKSLWARLSSGQDIATPIYGKNPFGYLYDGQGSLFGR